MKKLVACILAGFILSVLVLIIFGIFLNKEASESTAFFVNIFDLASWTRVLVVLLFLITCLFMVVGFIFRGNRPKKS